MILSSKQIYNKVRSSFTGKLSTPFILFIPRPSDSSDSVSWDDELPCVLDLLENINLIKHHQRKSFYNAIMILIPISNEKKAIKAFDLLNENNTYVEIWENDHMGIGRGSGTPESFRGTFKKFRASIFNEEGS